MVKFIEINGDIFSINKIQAIERVNQKNTLGSDSGVFLLKIYMESGFGSMSKAYADKKIRDEDFELAKRQLFSGAEILKGYPVE